MHDTMQLLDPTAETLSTRRKRHPPPPEFEGITLGLLDIGKARGSTFLDRLEMHFTGRGLAVKRYAKPTNTRTAPVELAQTVTEPTTSSGPSPTRRWRKSWRGSPPVDRERSRSVELVETAGNCRSFRTTTVCSDRRSNTMCTIRSRTSEESRRWNRSHHSAATERVESAENTEMVKVVCASAGGDDKEPKTSSTD